MNFNQKWFPFSIATQVHSPECSSPTQREGGCFLYYSVPLEVFKLHYWCKIS
jgi:hypothetical protein